MTKSSSTRSEITSFSSLHVPSVNTRLLEERGGVTFPSRSCVGSNNLKKAASGARSSASAVKASFQVGLTWKKDARVCLNTPSCWHLNMTSCVIMRPAERWTGRAVTEAAMDDRHQNTLKQSSNFPKKTSAGLPLKSCPRCMLQCVCMFGVKTNKPWPKRANTKVQAVTHQAPRSVR